MVNIEVSVSVTLDKTEGRFASKDEIEAEVLQWLEDANGGEVSGVGVDGTSTYEVTDWVVGVVG